MRLVNRSAVLFLGAVVTAGLVACGGDDGGSTGDDIDPTGTDNPYVVSRIQLPATANEATQFGLDIDELAGDAAGGIDNQLGTFLGSLSGIAPGLDLSGSLDEAVDTGSVVLLSNVKATALDNAAKVGMWVYIGDGDTAMPMPCTDATDTVCRHHLDGTGMFSIEAGSQTDAKMAGNIMAGTFTGGPGNINLQLSLAADSPPIDLPLQRAKASIKVTATGFATGSKLGGAIAQTDIETKIHPAIKDIVTDLIDRDCMGTPRTPPNCGCTSGSTGLSVLGFLDTATPRDCMVSVAEVTRTLNDLLQPDIDLDGNGVADAVSLGIGVQAVKGAFTIPM